MTVLLLKGQKATLGLAATRLRVGLGWNPRVNVGEEFDLDVSCFMLGSDDKVRSKNDLVFYNQTESPRGSVKHTGDNQTGEGGGDDEAILVDLTQVPDDVAKLLLLRRFTKRANVVKTSVSSTKPTCASSTATQTSSWRASI